MLRCLNCEGELVPARLSCADCGLAFEGTMRLPRLARLSPEALELAERLVVAGGNLTEVAHAVGVSHPTLRRRVAALREDLARLREHDEAEIASLLNDVEAGARSPEEAARLIGEINGTL